MNKNKILNLGASEAAKEAGYKSLKQLADFEDRSVNCLWRWHKSKPKLFKAAVIRNSHRIKEG